MKERLDVLLVTRELALSREKAKAIIMSGIVFVDGQREDKAGSKFSSEAEIEVRGKTLQYVSRGGLKLEKAMKTFDLDLKDKVCMDVGSSTGGFTDCMLQNGAQKVYAIDVGTNQLAWSLRQDPRVVTMEKTNIRYLKEEDIKDIIEFATIDVSFISLVKIFPVMEWVVEEGGELVCLIKPQFEAGRAKVGKRGVVKAKETHIEVIEKVMQSAGDFGFCVEGLNFSPIKGPEGNIEYLLLLSRKNKEDMDMQKDFMPMVNNIVDEAHKTL